VILSQNPRVRCLQKTVFALWIITVALTATAYLYHYTTVEVCTVNIIFDEDAPVSSQEVRVIKTVYPLLGKTEIKFEPSNTP